MPSFPTIANRPGASAERLAGRIIIPHPAMPGVTLTIAEIRDIVALHRNLEKGRLTLGSRTTANGYFSARQASGAQACLRLVKPLNERAHLGQNLHPPGGSVKERKVAARRHDQSTFGLAGH